MSAQTHFTRVVMHLLNGLKIQFRFSVCPFEFHFIRCLVMTATAEMFMVWSAKKVHNLADYVIDSEASLGIVSEACVKPTLIISVR